MYTTHQVVNEGQDVPYALKCSPIGSIAVKIHIDKKQRVVRVCVCVQVYKTLDQAVR